MASSVATPLERQFSTIADSILSVRPSTLGNTQITLQFDLSRNIDAAAQDVQTAISAFGAPTAAGNAEPADTEKSKSADQPLFI